MRPEQREELRRRYGYRCGYCGVSEVDSGSELTADHFHPRAHGGGGDPENLVYCCHACNEYKGDFYQPDSLDRILHPLRDIPSHHMAESDDGSLQGLTPTGAFHIDRLRLNRPPLIARRLAHRQLEMERRELLALRQRLAEVREEEKALEESEPDA